jgi:hypothetical protein
VSVFAAILIGLAGGALPAALITGFFTFRVNRATAMKVMSEATEVSKRTAVAEADAALKFADRRISGLEEDCDKCHQRLDGVTKSLDAVIEAVAVLMARVRPSNGHEVTITVTGTELAAVRGAVREARRHLT